MASSAVEGFGPHGPREFFSTITSEKTSPLWTVMDAMVPPKPGPKAIPTMWKYEKLRPLLIQSTEVVTAEEAERRVLMLVNPGRVAPYTTDTLYGGLQIILPGETAPAHRHMAFALRFIIEGEGGFTAVEGNKVMMKRGDVILTPQWSWHDHGHEGEGPLVWLDGLDLPVYQALPVNFAEMYDEPRYPSKLWRWKRVTEDPTIHFPWAHVQQDLDSQPGSHAVYTYYRINSNDGKRRPLSKTVGGQAERISKGTTSPVSQETISFIYHVYSGSGYTTVKTSAGEQQKMVWKAHDTFAVPTWAEVSHTADDAGEDAYLFAVTDRPLIDGIGAYRKA